MSSSARLLAGMGTMPLVLTAGNAAPVQLSWNFPVHKYTSSQDLSSIRSLPPLLFSKSAVFLSGDQAGSLLLLRPGLSAKA